MKRILPIASVSLLLTLVASCQSPTTSPGSSQGSGGTTTPAVNQSIKLYDANKNFIGYVTSSNAEVVTVYTSAGYFVSLTWVGTLTEGEIYFTGANGSGSPFSICLIAYPPSGGLETTMNGQPYVAQSVDSDGIAIPDLSITTYQSYYNGVTITNQSPAQSLSTTTEAVPLKQTQLSTVGLPSSFPLSLPLQLEFQ